MRLFLLIINSAFAINTFSQVEISGNVRDKNSGNSLYPATVYITQKGKIKAGTVTDEKGFFRLGGINSGDYVLQVDFLGYHSLKIPVDVGNTDITDYRLLMEVNEYFYLGTPIEITENPYKSGDLTMTQQQYKVMPASFQDPSRIMLRFPGFSTANDGANSILFRGMPPEATRWQLFGADIVNPNHLSNAGTANDLATGNAGGVNAMSGSVLDYYHFEANPADISYANVLSGVSNMEMAPNIKSFIDLNLIGLEAGLNFNRGDNAAGYFKNVYAAYRYSFVGILNQLGVDFGNEKIGYQDFSLYADIYKSNNKSLKLFSTLGSSRNMLSPGNSADSITRYKDLQKIDYKSKLGMGGLQFVWNGLQSVFRSTLVSSFRTDTRSELTDALSQPHMRFSIIRKNDREERVLSSHTAYQFTPEMVIDAELFFTFGLRMNLFNNSIIRDLQGEIIQGFMFYPYYQMEGTIFGKWRYKTGIGVLYDNISQQWTAEPIFNLHYAINDKLSLSLDYRFSTMQNFTEIQKLNRRVNEYRIQSGNSQFAIEYRLKEGLFRTSFYYHDIGDISNYTLSNGPSGGHFSAFNGRNLGNDLFIFYPDMQFSGLANARSYGADVYFENKVKLRSNALQYMVNSSVFESSYSLPENPDQYFNGKYNFRFSANASLAYLINFSGDEHKKNLIISLAGHYRGVLREQPATVEPFNEPFNIYDFNSPFTNSLRPYQRLDFRIVYTRQKAGSRFLHRWSLDIQNLLNRENDGFRYYDPFLQQILIQPQLGLVPVLSYRMEW